MVELALKVDEVKMRLTKAAEVYGDVTFASSLSAEDMVLTDLILRNKLNVSIFTIDTYKLHRETLGLIKKIKSFYNYEIDVFAPKPEALARLEEKQAEDDIFRSLKARKECCYQRKVVPLKAALQGKKAWVTGQRRSQSSTRSDLEFQSYDSDHGMEKLNPLADWSQEEIWQYLKHHNVPYNPLHDQNFPSIGCAPCTRAVRPGDDPRSGRWWWESSESKECGLHIVNGKIVRASNKGVQNVDSH